MSSLPTLLITLGLISLFHAQVSLFLLIFSSLLHTSLICNIFPFYTTNIPSLSGGVFRAYSAHEHSVFSSKHLTSPSLPLDIKLETLTSLILTSLGLVLNSEPLKPISWSKWAGQIEREGGGNNPFRTLEDRVGFMDIRAKRRDFSNWAKEGTQEVKA